MSCFILKQGLVAQVVPPPATQTEVNTGVNRFKYVTPYTLANSTIVGTNVALSAQGGTALLTNLNGTGTYTNKWNSWEIWGSPTVSNSLFAANRGLGIVTNSTSFSGLMQSIVNRAVTGFDIFIHPNPYYSNSYSADATITITNWGIIRGGGNPVTVIRATAALNGPVFQVGTTTIGSGGINRFKDIRIEGDNAGANGVGVKIVDCAEPVFRDMETTGFKRAGIELASTNYMHWAYADHCWFVTKDAGAKGILVSGAPISSDRAQNHFDINDCNFGVFGGGEPIFISTNFPNVRVTDSIFKYSSGTMSYGISQENGRDALYSGNKFVNFSAAVPIMFAASGTVFSGVTNLNPTFVNNHSDGTAEIIQIGQFVTNVTLSANSIRGSGATVVYEDIASNGRINNLDQTELRLGHLTTNTIPYIGAYGEVKTATLSGLSLSGGTLTASGSGSPGGVATSVQYNTGGAFDGTNTFVYDEAGEDLTIWAVNSSPSISVGYQGGGSSFTNKMVINGMTVVGPLGSQAQFTFSNVGVVDGTVDLGTNHLSPNITHHLDLGRTTTLWKRLYLSSNAIVGGGLTVTGAVSVVGNASIPMMGLSSFQGDMMAFTRATNSPAATGSTNDVQIDRGTVTVGQPLVIMSTASGQHVLTNGNIRFTPTAISGVGGANTNFTLLSTQPEVYINGFTNVSIRAVMGYSDSLVDYWSCNITNGSGSDRTLEFSAVTNRYRFAGTYGTNAPSVLTNATRLEISGRQQGTNVQVVYSYFAWP